MSGHRDDDKTRDFGSNNRSSSSSHSSEKEHKIDAAKLGDMIIADGRLFGVKMPQETIDQVRKIIPIALVYLTDKGQDLVTKHFNAKAGQAAGLALAFSEQIAETLQNLYNLVTSLDNLHATMRPAARATGNASALTMNNEAIDDLRSKIISLFMHRMMDTVVGAVGAIPALMVTLGKNTEKSKKFEGIEEIQATKGDPNEIANVLEGQYHGGGKTGLNKGVTGEQIARGEKVLIGRKLVEYEKDFAAYKLANTEKVKATLTTTLKELNEVEYSLQLDKIKDMGIPTAKDLISEINKSRAYTDQQRANQRRFRGDHPSFGPDPTNPRQKTLTFADDVKLLLSEFTDPILKGKNLDTYVDTALRREYVEKHGAFNEEWRKHATNEEMRKAPTKETELKEFFKKQNTEHQQLQKEADAAIKKDGLENKMRMLWDNGPALIAGFARDMVIQLVGGKSLAKLQKPLAAERVAHLAKVLTPPAGESNWLAPKKVPPLLDKNGKISKSNDESLSTEQSYAHYIHEIFQAQQSYHQRPEVGSRFTQNFDKVRWDDDAIRKMNDDQLSPYEYAIKHITMRVVDRELAVSAILNFIGDRSGYRLVHPDGQNFGPKGSGQNPDDIKAAILKMIDDSTNKIRVGNAVSPEQMSEKMANWLFKVEDVKQALEKDGDPEWRNFTFRLFSNEVIDDGIICSKLAISNERCQELRKASTDFNERLDGMFFVLAQKLDVDPKGFDEMLTLTSADKKLVVDLNQQLKKQGGHIAEIVNQQDKAALKTLALNIAMTVGQQEEFQSDIKLAMEELKNLREAAPKLDHASEGHPDRARDSDRDSDRHASRDRDNDRDNDRGRDRERDRDRDSSSSRDRDSDDRSATSRSSHEREDSYSRHSSDEERHSEERTASHADRVGKRLRVDAPSEDKYAGRHEKKRTVENRSAESFSKRVQRDETETVRGGLG